MPNISIAEIENALAEMKNNKSPGDDGIAIESIKQGGNTLLHAIKTLFNTCLEEGVIPSKWNNASTVVLYKKGDITKLENYRPISLLPHIYL